LDVNLTGHYLMAREVAAEILKREIKESVIWALELAPNQIRVAGIAPGVVETPILNNISAESKKDLLEEFLSKGSALPMKSGRRSGSSSSANILQDELFTLMAAQIFEFTEYLKTERNFLERRIYGATSVCRSICCGLDWFWSGWCAKQEQRATTRRHILRKMRRWSLRQVMRDRAKLFRDCGGITATR
jgi:hypothetical protein